MANRHDQPNLHEDAELERLLLEGYASTAPDPGFQQALLNQLDTEFRRTRTPSASVDQAKSSETMPGSINAALNGAASDNHGAITSFASASTPRPRRLVGLRLAISLATAASLLFAVALWGNQSAYGWASMLKALESCTWVQAYSETAGLSGWVSSQRGIVAIRGMDKIAFHDHRQQTSSQYLSEHQVVYRQSLASDRRAAGTEQLFRLLLHGDDHSSEDRQQDFSVVSESWNRVESAGGEAEAVELRVTLRGSGPRRPTYELLVLVDAETHLPKSVRLVADDPGAAKSLDFSYPTEGPQSIFSLGIPGGTKVVESLANLEVSKPGEVRDAESIRSLAGDAERSDEGKNSATADNQESIAHVASRPESSTLGSQVSPDQADVADGSAIVVQTDEIITPVPDAKEHEPAQEERIAANPLRPVREVAGVALPEKPLSSEALIERVNAQLAASWQRQGINAAEQASDTEFLRRVYLDLTGRIPVVSEVYQFLDDDPDGRRERLVDELLSSRDHATHLATVWRKLLLPDGVDASAYGGTGKFDEWLADRFEKNIPYDQLASELLLAEGRVSDSGPILFYAALKLNPEELAAKTSRTFLGMRMECAQCHDDKFDDSLTQEDFWGFAAHFAQISRPRGKIEMTSSVLRVRDNDQGEVMLPDTDEVVPPRMPYEFAAADFAASKAKGEASGDADSRSRRQILVDWLTTKQNHRFARATVNRAWQHLFGLGLVEPVDDMRDDNLPICPEVLETLSLDFAANEYDLRRLLRTLALSDAYQLSSRSATDEPSQAQTFARMNIKSFSADQLYDCINVATEPDSMGRAGGAEGALARFGNTARQAFIEQFQAPPGQRTDYHAGIPQALTLMHGRLVHGATDLESSGLLKSLNAPFFSDEQRIETLFLATLSRFPDEVEKEKMLAHVQAATSDEQRSSALGDILWALLNSAEFTFIH